MRYTTIVVAAFLALASGITGAPIEARTGRTNKVKTPTIIVVGSGNGGDGGSNFALPIAISGASSSSWGAVKGGKVVTTSSSENFVGQNANGGDGSAVGSYGEHNTFYPRTGKSSPSINVAPVVDPSIIILSGNGGSGGLNLGVPIAISGAKSDTGSVKNGGKVTTGSSAGNVLGQSANGGAGSAVGSYGKNNWFGARDEEFEERSVEFEEFEERGEDLEARTYKAPKAPSILVYGSGNGGDGGQNYAIPIAISGAKSDTGSVKWGTVKTGSSAGNVVQQSANGGVGSAVGSYGSDNHFGGEKRTNYKAPKAPYIAVIGSGNGGNGGHNLAIPIAISGAKSNTGSVKYGGTVKTGSSAGNEVYQNADGGAGSAVGSYGSDNHFGGEKRTNYKAPKAPYIAVIGSGNGGNGGTNVAVPVAVSGAKSNTGSVKYGGKVKTDSSAGNEVWQSADGGDGSAVGSYGSGNHFSS